jgi:hypothetical protein
MAAKNVPTVLQQGSYNFLQGPYSALTWLPQCSHWVTQGSYRAPTRLLQDFHRVPIGISTLTVNSPIILSFIKLNAVMPSVVGLPMAMALFQAFQLD